ncbi:unnamed protein product [Heligmosomoides polygyrus]|uniref:Uncharacterized protein n=1 Tax=Heligmosomoides polygyrus TaxID=6339 RepID=A0A3P8BV45_HELPZ|nr:unnamed protein product [Heligmosomoides polygyrus]
MPPLAALRVLELGAGTGICGLVLAAIGADVTITDLPSRIPLLQKNYEVNKSNCIGSVQIKPLDWAAAERLPDVEVLVLVDCIYYSESVDCLLNILNSCNAQEILCVYEKRDIGEPVLAQREFMEKVVQHYDLIFVSESDLHPEYSCCEEILVIKLARKYVRLSTCYLLTLSVMQ